MPRVIPFRALRYNPTLTPDLSDVITPPYDVINPTLQEELYSKHPYNFINLELGKEFPGDTERKNRYSRARATLDAWLASGVLIKDPEPSFYFSQQCFTYWGRQFCRSQLFAAVELTDFARGEILPHEATLAKPKQDRLNLLRSCQANFSPVFGLYRDPAGIVVNRLSSFAGTRKPDCRVQDAEGSEHRLWVINDTNLLAEIAGLFVGNPVYIADGHHRYETALENSRSPGVLGQEPARFVLMSLVEAGDPGLVLLPTHRVVKSQESWQPEKLLAILSETFTLEKIGIVDRDYLEVISQLLNKDVSGEYRFGLFLKGSGLFLLRYLSFEQRQIQNRVAEDLPVSILQHLVFDNVLGVDPQRDLQYTRDVAEALQLVQDGTGWAAFFLPHPKVEEVLAVASARGKMPQKSTYFWPKLPSGLVVYPFF